MLTNFIAAVLVASNLAGPAGAPQDEQAGGPPQPTKGLAGTLHVSEGNRDDTDMVLPMEVEVGDTIQLNFNYPQLFEAGPASVEGQSGDPSIVKFQEARFVTAHRPPRDGNTLAGFFVAEAPGKTDITFVVSDPVGDEGIGGLVKRTVTVREPEGR